MTLPSDAQQRNAGDIDKTLCEEALRIVQGNRREKYDIPERNFHRVALAWQSITDRAYTAQEIALMFVALKLVRQSHAAQRDNIVDGIGYLLCADAVTEKPAEQSEEPFVASHLQPCSVCGEAVYLCQGFHHRLKYERC